MICINTFGAGQHGSGMMALDVMKNVYMTAIGDTNEKVYNLLREVQHLGKKIHIYGLPYTIRNIVDKMPIDVCNIIRTGHVSLIIGGESILENYRNYMINKGFKVCYGVYGATDLGSMIGSENDYTIAIRKLCQNNCNIRQELMSDLSKDVLPTIFVYDPHNYYIESLNDNLLFSTANYSMRSPRIRYDLGDTGVVMPYSKVEAIVRNHTDIKSDSGLPIVCVAGRNNYGLGGVELYELESAINLSLELNNVIDFGIKMRGGKICFILEVLQNPVLSNNEILFILNTRLRQVNPLYSGNESNTTVEIYCKSDVTDMMRYDMANPNLKRYRIFKDAQHVYYHHN